jgi:hypothetical protein
MRVLTQPGPVAVERIAMAGTAGRALAFTPRPGLSLHDALTVPMLEAGFQGGAIELRDVALDPFQYVMPGPPDDASHVAYFTAPRAPVGVTRLERANLTFGFADGAPALHCHAVWTEPDGRRRGGHILPKETFIAAGGSARAIGFAAPGLRTGFDAETNFTLFDVSPAPLSNADTVIARARPNIDITEAVEAIAAARFWRDADLLGGVGSLVGARFTDGREVTDYATEVLIRHGQVRDGRARLDLAVVDMAGAVHEGELARGENAVLITFDLVLRGVG